MKVRRSHQGFLVVGTLAAAALVALSVSGAWSSPSSVVAPPPAHLTLPPTTSPASPAVRTSTAPASPAVPAISVPAELPLVTTASVHVNAQPWTNFTLSVPFLGLTTRVVRLGLNADGTLEVPTSFHYAGWWSGGPKPGNVGPAVIIGHVSSKSGPGVFYELTRMTDGKKIVIQYSNGVRDTFSVTRTMEVAKRTFPSALVYGPQKTPELRLVTCTGAFDSSTGHFLDSFIVFAKLVSRSVR